MAAPAAGTQPHHYNTWILVSLMLGTALEWYDFSVVAQLDKYLGANFFPEAATPEIRNLAVWLLYAASFVVRPLGAILFGSVADVWGRKTTLITTLILMGSATTLIGCLPTYQHIGPAAPALLAALRVCMGLSLGAEYTTAIVYVHEAAAQGHKAFHASIVAAACAMGSMVGLSVVMIVEAATDDAQMMLWGYRVPFLSAFPIVFTALLLRWQMPESDEFLASRRAAQEPAPAGAFSDSAGDALAAPHPKAAAPGAGRAAPRGAAARIPLARLLRTQWLGLLLDTLFVAWLTSVIYVVYAWIPSQLRSRKIMVPLTSLGMCLTSLVSEFAGIIAGGWAAPRMPSLVACAAAAPLLSAFVLATLAAMDSGAIAAIWIMHNLALGFCGFLLGVHAACFVYVYQVDTRSTGFSLAYNSGSALGGTAPAIVSAIQIAVKAQPLAWQLAPGIWISCLAALAAAAATGLLWAAPLVNRSGRRGGGHRAGACEMAAA